MRIFEKLQNLDKRVFYLLMALAIAIPTIWPLGLEVSITPPVRKTYDFVEGLPAGSIALIGFDYEPGDEIELSPQAKALFRQFAAKRIRVVTIASYPVGPMFADECLKVLKDLGYEYGLDYVNLGYYAGGESTLAAFARDPSSIFTKDWYGNDISSLPLMQEIKNMASFSMAMTLNDGPTGGTGTHEWVRQSVMAYGTPFVIGCTGVLAANNMPYLDAGQVKGVLSGLRAAAEYEKLVGIKGDATRGMDAQSMGHVLIVLFVLLGNIGMVFARRRSNGGEKR